jgi:hypothetical protein
MGEQETISKLQHIGDVLSNKFRCSFNGTFRASNPVYNLPRPLTLPKNRNFEAALIYFATDNYLANIDKSNQQFIYSTDSGKTWKTIKIPVGAYELSSIDEEIKRQMRTNGDAGELHKSVNSPNSNYINIEGNINTFCSVIEITKDGYQVDFRPDNTIRDLLGFNAVVLTKGRHKAPRTAQITAAKAINIHCSLVHRSYDSKGNESDIIYSFPAYKVGVGYKINEEPNTPRYLPVAQDVIKQIRFRITDNNNKELTFEDEECAFSLYVQQV